MWYWFYEIASVTLVIGLVALILWWAWRQETAGRFADTLDRRFAKEKPKVKWWRTKDWPESTLEQRVRALEKVVNTIHKLSPPLPLATPSRATESHIKGDPLGAEQDYTTPPTLRFSPSDPRIIKGGHAERLSEFAEPEDVLT